MDTAVVQYAEVESIAIEIPFEFIPALGAQWTAETDDVRNQVVCCCTTRCIEFS